MWQIRIQDPSGETRRIPLNKFIKQKLTLGSCSEADIPLRDPTSPKAAALLWRASEDGDPTSGFWLRTPDDAPEIRLGDIEIREAHLPPGIPISIGETKLLLEQTGNELPLPAPPAGVRPWLTRSPRGREVLWTTRKAAETPLSIYLAGETGTGKEVLAHLVHGWSDRRSGPFVPLHCAALPLSLVESELFGHVKGAFTGAAGQRAGALMQAHQGTLFLDEVGDLPMDIQVKLLRFLENGEIRPVGSDRSCRADVRLVCATHHPLEQLVENGKFRRDLYYRLASVTIDIPNLRSRLEDTELLTQTFCAELGRTVSPRAMLRLKAHDWPGNVRELRHAIERACGLAGQFTQVLGEEAFDFLLTPKNVDRSPELELGAPILKLEEMERIMVLRALQLAGGNRSRAARILGVARSTLFEMIRRHRIIGPRARGGSSRGFGSSHH